MRSAKKIMSVSLLVAGVVVVGVLVVLGSVGDGFSGGVVEGVAAGECPFDADTYDLRPVFSRYYKMLGGEQKLVMSVEDEARHDAVWSRFPHRHTAEQTSSGYRIWYEVEAKVKHVGGDTVTVLAPTDTDLLSGVREFELDMSQVRRNDSPVWSVKVVMKVAYDGVEVRGCLEEGYDERLIRREHLPDAGGIWPTLTATPVPSTPTHTPEPTATPVCAPARDASDFAGHTVVTDPYMDAWGRWNVRLLWQAHVLPSDGTTIRSYVVWGPLNFERVGNPLHGVGYMADIVINEDGQPESTYSITLEYRTDGGHCVAGSQVLTVTLPDYRGETCAVPMAERIVNPTLFWVESQGGTHVRLVAKFRTLDWADFYVVDFVGDYIRERHIVDGFGRQDLTVQSGDKERWMRGGRVGVWVRPMSATCAGTLWGKYCTDELCPLVDSLDVAPEAPGSCSTFVNPVVGIAGTPNASTEYNVAVRVWLAVSAATGYDIRTSYRGGAPVVRRITAAEAASDVVMGSFAAPASVGDFWEYTAQARGVNTGPQGCEGPWGPVSTIQLYGGLTSQANPGVNPTPAVTPSPTVPPTPGGPGATPAATPTRSTPGATPVTPIGSGPPGSVTLGPVDYRTWRSRTNDGQDPGHYPWCYNGEYDDRMDIYYAGVNEFSVEYSKALKAAKVANIQREVDRSVEETFESPGEFCSRIGFFGMVRFGLAWLQGIVVVLALASALVLIAVKSAAGSSPGTQVWVKQATIGLGASVLLVAMVWIIFEALIAVMFGVGVEDLPVVTTGSGSMVAVGAWRGLRGLLSSFLPGRIW